MVQEVDKNNLILEKKYLSAVIYNGEFNGHVEEIDPNERYKASFHEGNI